MSGVDVPAALGPFFAAWAAAVGAAVGSFLNVVIARLPAGQSLVRPGSRCPRCGAAIRWYDNVPVLSWLLLRARCRACGVRISARYPLVEALGAGAALVAYARHGLSGAAAAELAFAAALIALAFIDLDSWLLPHAITRPLIVFGVVANGLGVAPAGSLRASASGAAIGFGVFAALSWFGEKALRKEALGFGDVWLLSGLGAWMGPAALLPIVLLASVQGSVVGIALVLVGKGQPGPPPRQDEAELPRERRSGSERPEGGPAEPGPARARSEAEAGEAPTRPDDDWVPPKNAVPFGPFLVAGALEWLWLGALLARAFPALGVFR